MHAVTVEARRGHGVLLQAAVNYHVDIRNAGPLQEQQDFFVFFFFFLSLSLSFFFLDRVSLCSPGCPGTHSVDQAGLELRNPSASASEVLGLMACATTPGSVFFFLKITYLCNFSHV
jgi:hypothetical protein